MSYKPKSQCTVDAALGRTRKSNVNQDLSRNAFGPPEEFAAALLNSTTVGVAILDERLRFKAVNSALAAINGVPGAAHLGKTIHEVLGDVAFAVEGPIQRVFTTGMPLEDFELSAVLPTRTAPGRWIEKYFPIRDSTGQILVAAMVVEVTTDTRRSQSFSGSTQQEKTAGTQTERALVVKQEPILRGTGHAEQSKAPARSNLRSALFQGVDGGAVEAILDAAKRCRRSRGDNFCCQGETATDLYLLTAGLVKVTGITTSGKQVTLDWMHPGEVFGVGALLSFPINYIWTVTATEDSEALSWDRASLNRFVERSPQFRENTLGIPLQWTSQLQERFEELSCATVDERLAHCLLYLNRRFKDRNRRELHMSDEDLAQMAGTNLFTVNKILNRWQRLGYLQKRRMRILILDEDSLLQISLPLKPRDGSKA